jgi:anaerobic selenocysteine-containing dehydrogenase
MGGVPTTFCRICSGICGLQVEVADGRVTSVRGDAAHPLSQGYTCVKGRRFGALHAREDRFLSARRGTDELPILDATREVGKRLRAIAAEHGPDSIAMFRGTQATTSALTFPFCVAFWRATGSRSLYTTMTIDQSAKWVTESRLGRWLGGRQRFEDADVWLLAGTNPLVSLQGGDLTGFPIHNPSRALRDARRRGLRLIVIDPRRTETAARADLHLQLRPGTDAVLYGGLLHQLFADGLVDREFCLRHVQGKDALRCAVAGLTPEVVAERCGLKAAEIVEAARLFGRARRGMAMSGTGVDMGPFSNLAEHLLSCLNVVCGRFPRAGEAVAHPAVLRAPVPARAQVAGPEREWERDPGTIHGELPSSTLPEAIRSGRVRALLVAGANPAANLPGAADVLGQLELLATIEPFPTETARFADYVLPPALAFERPDFTRPYESYFTVPFAQYTDALLPRPEGVLEDWEILWELAAAMDLTLRVGGLKIAPGDERPSSPELLDRLGGRGRVPLSEVRGHEHGAVFDLPALRVLDADATASRFDVLPDDVAAELRAARAALPAAGLRLVVRRVKRAMNTLGADGENPCSLHPDDLAALGLREGDAIELRTAHGAVRAVAAADVTLRPGTVSLTHGFTAVNAAHLVSATEDVQDINAMPVMTALPATVRAARTPSPAPSAPAP